MLKKKSSLNIKHLMEDMNRASRLLKRSSYIFEDYGMNPQDEQQYMGGEEMPQEEMGADEAQQMADAEQPQVSEETVDTINKIRELAIQGIAQYANDVESEEYQALKKIWLLTDKFYEGMNEEDDKKKNF